MPAFTCRYETLFLHRITVLGQPNVLPASRSVQEHISFCSPFGNPNREYLYPFHKQLDRTIGVFIADLPFGKACAFKTRPEAAGITRFRFAGDQFKKLRVQNRQGSFGHAATKGC